MTTETTATVLDEGAAELLSQIAEARQKAVAWLVDRIGDDGKPEGADERNSWWRAPWALAAAGATDAAAAMLGWIEREALTDEGDLRGGAIGGDALDTPVYQLSPIAIASWMLARYSTAERIMDRMEHWTDPVTGGVWEFKDHSANPLQDTLKTCQLGISSLITGRTSVSEGVNGWLKHAWDAQPELHAQRFYPSFSDGVPVTDFPEQQRLLRVVEFTQPRQLYFHTGIAAAFLAGYAQQTGDAAAIDLGERYLALNKQGTERQYDDERSVQICKFGWGVAWMNNAAPHSGQQPWVTRMGQWFVDRQRPDGAWEPSSFLAPEHRPDLLDLYWKTAEHLMELSYIEQSLLATRA